MNGFFGTLFASENNGEAVIKGGLASGIIIGFIIVISYSAIRETENSLVDKMARANYNESKSYKLDLSQRLIESEAELKFMKNNNKELKKKLKDLNQEIKDEKPSFAALVAYLKSCGIVDRLPNAMSAKMKTIAMKKMLHCYSSVLAEKDSDKRSVSQNVYLALKQYFETDISPSEGKEMQRALSNVGHRNLTKYESEHEKQRHEYDYRMLFNKNVLIDSL